MYSVMRTTEPGVWTKYEISSVISSTVREICQGAASVRADVAARAIAIVRIVRLMPCVVCLRTL